MADNLLGKLLWPEGSKLRIVIHAGINIRETIGTGREALRAHGVGGLFGLVADRWKHGNVGEESALEALALIPIQPIESIELPDLGDPSTFELESEPVVSVGAGVSIVIPALNASHELLQLLPTLNAQKGFSRIEVIVVDSGSADDTVLTAREYGAKVVSIPSSEFSHSGSRNLGVEQATQEFVLCITADALPTSDTWLNQLHKYLSANDLAAVSCMEIPRSNADLFFRVENWYHYRYFLEVDDSDCILSLPAESSVHSLRKSAQLSNVACLYRREIVQRYKFREEYAEDLDIGIRLIEDGHKLGLMSSVKVIHSHSRPPAYYLKRGYIDKLVVAQILRESSSKIWSSLDELIADIFLSLQVVQAATRQVLAELVCPARFVDFRRIIQARFIKTIEQGDISPSEIDADRFLDAQSREFLKKLKLVTSLPAPEDPRILKNVLGFQNHAFMYMETVYDIVDESIVSDYLSLTYNALMNHIGRGMAECYIHGSTDEPRLQVINDSLRSG